MDPKDFQPKFCEVFAATLPEGREIAVVSIDNGPFEFYSLGNESAENLPGFRTREAAVEALISWYEKDIHAQREQEITEEEKRHANVLANISRVDRMQIEAGERCFAALKKGK